MRKKTKQELINENKELREELELEQGRSRAIIAYYEAGANEYSKIINELRSRVKTLEKRANYLNKFKVWYSQADYKGTTLEAIEYFESVIL